MSPFLISSFDPVTPITVTDLPSELASQCDPVLGLAIVSGPGLAPCRFTMFLQGAIRTPGSSKRKASRQTGGQWPQTCTAEIEEVTEKLTMHMFFSFLMAAGLAGRTEENPHLKAAVHDGLCERARGSIVVVAEGSENWQGRTADRLVAGFNSALGSCQVVQVLRFDAEPSATAEVSVEGTDGDLLVLRPRTPLRDAAVAGLQWLSKMQGPRSLILIAHEQFYASAVSADQLIALAHRSKTTLHTVHIASREGRGGIFKRLTQAVRDGTIWLVESIGEPEHSSSAAVTGNFLKRLAVATKGTACVSEVEPRESSCLSLIAARIGVNSQSNASAPPRQSDCENSMQEPR